MYDHTNLTFMNQFTAFSMFGVCSTMPGYIHLVFMRQFSASINVYSQGKHNPHTYTYSDIADLYIAL